jgi:hypothetical protein
MLLRRAPREVYRVYAEDEFFACASEQLADTERLERVPAARAAARGRTLRRLAGPTMLVAATGALGGLVLLADRSHPGRAGAPRPREVAASGSTGATRPARLPGTTSPARRQAWREMIRPPVGAGETVRKPGRDGLVRRIAASAHSTLRQAPRAALAHPVLAAVRGPLAPASTTPAPVPARVASVSAQASDPGQAEFGFERAGRE